MAFQKHIRPRHEGTERNVRRKLLKKRRDNAVRMMECSGTEDAFVLYDFHYFCSFNLDYKYKVICKNNFILASYGSD